MGAKSLWSPWIFAVLDKADFEFSSLGTNSTSFGLLTFHLPGFSSVGNSSSALSSSSGLMTPAPREPTGRAGSRTTSVLGAGLRASRGLCSTAAALGCTRGHPQAPPGLTPGSPAMEVTARATLHALPLAAVNNGHKPIGLNVLSESPEGRVSKLRCQRGWEFLLEAPGEGLSLPFPASRGPRAPWLMDPPCSGLCSVVHPLWLHPSCLPLVRTLVITLGPGQCRTLSRSPELQSNHICRAPLPHQVTRTGSGSEDMGTFGAVILPLSVPRHGLPVNSFSASTGQSPFTIAHD